MSLTPTSPAVDGLIGVANASGVVGTSVLDITAVWGLGQDTGVWTLVSDIDGLIDGDTELTIGGGFFALTPTGTDVSGLDDTTHVITLTTGVGGINEGTFTWDLEMAPVPEPHEYAMLAGLGLFGFAAYRRMRA